jgi:tRNA (guanine-N7-)-methyltransferase
LSRRIQLDIPGPDWRVDLAEAASRGWPALFGSDVAAPLPLIVELGFGRGEFLLGLAEASPTQAHVGVELSFKRSVKMARRLARSPLRNVRLVQGLAQQVVQEALPDASVACFWINFPDPWPKKRHARRRLLQPELAVWLVRRLVPGGSLRIATDDAPYALWIDAVLREVPELENVHAPQSFAHEEEGRTQTAYEVEWRAQGRALHFFHYRRKTPGAGDR